MALQEIIDRLTEKHESPSISISFNTYVTNPDREKNAITLKNLIKEAENRIVEEFGKRDAAEVLEKLANLPDTVADHQLSKSLHIFISKDTEELVSSPWEVENESVSIDDSFALRPLIKAMNRTKDYMILTVAQGGAHLYEASNDTISKEIVNDDFPFDANPLEVSGSDANKIENRLKEYFNQIDKAAVAVHNENKLDVVVIATEPNYAMLMEVADVPKMYVAHQTKNYDQSEADKMAKDAYESIENLQKEERAAAIGELKQAVSSGQVLTDLQDIYQAAIDGRGELLITLQDFEQPVKMTSDRTFDLADDAKEAGVVDDIVSTIAWNVISKGGRSYFTAQEELEDLGKIVLKVRY
ncbi:baeRF3 domain-containing protein [Sphingobacterium lactis]|uniref:baeRF3 domain-containing protein n=1 Tax=Sphingobacterium lactis TaxID=797291 RepID=UPI003EC6D9E5